MTIEQAIYNYLTAAPRSLTVYPVRLPQDPPLPAVTYTRVATPMIRTIRGGKVYNPVFQFDCWAASYAGAKGLAASVRDALDGFSGLMGGVGGVQVQAIYINSEMDDFEATPGIYRVIVEATIWHE